MTDNKTIKKDMKTSTDKDLTGIPPAHRFCVAPMLDWTD
jgi:hypothetical protein